MLVLVNVFAFVRLHCGVEVRVRGCNVAVGRVRECIAVVVLVFDGRCCSAVLVLGAVLVLERAPVLVQVLERVPVLMLVLERVLRDKELGLLLG